MLHVNGLIHHILVDMTANQQGVMAGQYYTLNADEAAEQRLAAQNALPDQDRLGAAIVDARERQTVRNIIRELDILLREINP